MNDIEVVLFEPPQEFQQMARELRPAPKDVFWRNHGSIMAKLDYPETQAGKGYRVQALFPTLDGPGWNRF